MFVFKTLYKTAVVEGSPKISSNHHFFCFEGLHSKTRVGSRSNHDDPKKFAKIIRGLVLIVLKFIIAIFPVYLAIRNFIFNRREEV